MPALKKLTWKINSVLIFANITVEKDKYSKIHQNEAVELPECQFNE